MYKTESIKVTTNNSAKEHVKTFLWIKNRYTSAQNTNNPSLTYRLFILKTFTSNAVTATVQCTENKKTISRLGLFLFWAVVYRLFILSFFSSISSFTNHLCNLYPQNVCLLRFNSQPFISWVLFSQCIPNVFWNILPFFRNSFWKSYSFIRPSDTMYASRRGSSKRYGRAGEVRSYSGTSCIGFWVRFEIEAVLSSIQFPTILHAFIWIQKWWNSTCNVIVHHHPKEEQNRFTLDINDPP